MEIKTASGRIYDLNFEPINTLIKSSSSYTRLIIDQINSGIYNDSIQAGIIVDAGANIGLFTIYASTVAYKIYAIEPTLEHYNNMVSILQQLNITNVIPINAALWTETGTVQFNLIGDNSTMNSIKNISDNKVSVSSIDLPTLFDKYNIEHVNYFKCDIEGAEVDVIENEKFAQVAPKINTFFVEAHGNPLKETTDKVEQRIRQLFPNVIRKNTDTVIATI
jgi:FkbM family methyltransferase